MTSSNAGPLILGGTGKVGRALRAVWPADAPTHWQARHSGEFPWDILRETAPVWPEDARGIICLAGIARGENLDHNTALALAACELGARAGQPVLLASSQAVYGRVEGSASEKSPCHPDTDYGRAKLAMEQAVSHFENVTILRIGNVIGCDNLMLNVARGKSIKLDQFPDGAGPRRSYIGPRTLGHILRKLIAHHKPLPPILNVSQAGSITMADILSAAGVAWEWTPASPSALPALDLDSTLLQSIVDVPQADPAILVAEAIAAGWTTP